jgi:hypothetical protein
LPALPVEAGILWALSVVLLITGAEPDFHAIFYGFGQKTNITLHGIRQWGSMLSRTPYQDCPR